MFARVLGNEWDSGGPITVHDPDWVAERWGRAFEIVSHAPRVMGEPWPHDLVVAGPRPGRVTEDDLLATGADGAAEGRARSGQLRLVRADALARAEDENERARRAVEAAHRARAGLEARASSRLAELAARYAELERERAAIRSSRVWRVTQPGRALAELRGTASGVGRR